MLIIYVKILSLPLVYVSLTLSFGKPETFMCDTFPDISGIVLKNLRKCVCVVSGAVLRQ